MTPKLVLLLAALLLIPAVRPAQAQATDPAVMQVQALHAALLKSMKAGRALSMSARYQSLAPVVERVFALPLMTRLAVGPPWSSFSQGEQKASIAAFTRFTIANYAFNFHDYDGQTFQIDNPVVSRGEDRIVRARIVSAHGTSTSLLYRMREVDGTWKVLDVISDGVSELTLRRADFAGAVNAGGSSALVDYLNKASDGLMK